MSYKITRSEEYQADERIKEEDDIQHFKYVSKEKVDGKWRYYYYHKTGKGHASIYTKTKGDPNSEYGTYEDADGRGNGKRDVIVKSKGNKLFGERTTFTVANTTLTHEVDGLIEQAAKKTVNSIRKFANNGRIKLRKLLGIH